MTDIIPYVSNTEQLYERAASVYLELWDDRGRPPKHRDVAEAMQEKWDEYDSDYVLGCLACKEFESTLTERRRVHLLYTMVPRLLAAEMGTKLGRAGYEELMRRLEEAPEDLSERVLLDMYKTGFEFAGKLDTQIEEATGQSNIQVNVEFKDMLLALPPDEASILVGELARRVQTGK